MALLLASLQAQLGLRSLAQQSYGRLRLASRVSRIHRPSRDPGDDIHLPSAGPASEAVPSNRPIPIDRISYINEMRMHLSLRTLFRVHARSQRRRRRISTPRNTRQRWAARRTASPMLMPDAGRCRRRWSLDTLIHDGGTTGRSEPIAARVRAQPRTKPPPPSLPILQALDLFANDCQGFVPALAGATNTN